MHTTKEINMTRRTAVSAIGNLFDIFGSAISVSRAVEARRTPHSRDLEKLGIDPTHFNRIGRL
jgi:hypothetical protein